MQNTTGVPPPPPSACPLCGAPYDAAVPSACRGCGVDLGHPIAEQIRVIDAQRAHLTSQRARLASELHTVPAGPPSREVRRTVPASSADSGTGGGQRRPGAAIAPDSGLEASGAAATPRGAPTIGVPSLLGLAGAALLTTAAVVFTAVTWERLPALVQAALLVAVAAVAAGAAVVLHRRHLDVTAGALGLLATALTGVVVVGAERSDLTEFAEFTTASAAAGAAVAGWLLARTGVRWTANAGSGATLLTAVAATAAIAETSSLSLAGVALIGSSAAAAVGVVSPLWHTAAARLIAEVGAGAFLTVCGLAGVATLSQGEVSLALGAAAVLAPASILAVAAWRWFAALAPATLLGTTGALATAAHFDVREASVFALAGLLSAVVAWGSTRLDPRSCVAARIGSLPVAILAAQATLVAVTATTESLVASVMDDPAPSVDPWWVFAATAFLAAIAVFPVVRRRFVTLTAIAFVIASGAVPAPLACLVLLAVAATAIAGRPPHVVDSTAVLLAASTGAAWVASDTVALLAAATVTALLAGVLLVLATANTAGIAAGIGSVAAGVAVFALVRTLGSSADLAVGIGVIVVFVATVAAVRVRTGVGTAPVIAAAAVATLAGPLLIESVRMTAVTLLFAAVGWLALAVVGRSALRWVAAVVSSSGTTLLVGDLGIDVVEAYTVPAALALAAAGLWWLVEDQGVRTMTALTPALATGMLPSLVVLAADPRTLFRPVLLVAVAGSMAAAGLKLRWLAPVGAAAACAAWVAVAQLSLVVAEVPRWVVFAIAGTGLVWLAATYERQQRRAGELNRSLRGFR